MHTIKIFLASSEELRQERLELADLVENLNRALEKRDINIQLVKWEYLDASMGPERKQEEYNAALKECEMCIVLYWTRFGLYTKEELDTAYQELLAGHNPRKLYVYFKDGGDITAELKSFRDSFTEVYGHYYNRFENIDTLKADFLLQFINYQSQVLGEKNFAEVRNSQVVIDGHVYVDLKNVPFAGNNEEYNLLQKNIKKTERLMAVTEPDDPDYSEYAKDLLDMKDRLKKMESSLWDTALYITRLSTQKCSERLERAMKLFNEGDNKGANAILDEEDIARDVEHNLNLVRLGEEGKKALETNIEEYKLKIKTLKNEMSEGWLKQIVDLREKILKISQKIYGERSKETADAYADLGEAYTDMPDLNKALESEEKAFEIRLALFGEQHADTAQSYNDLGVVYGQLGNHKKSLECDQKALEIRLALFGEEHADTAESFNDVGFAYGKLGDNNNAQKYEQKALGIYLKIYGEEHPDTATSYNNVGSTFGELGDHQKALEYEQKALEIRLKIFGKEHPDTANSYNNVGMIYGGLGDYQKKLKYEQKALNIFLKIYGEEHPDTALSYINVGMTYGDLGDYQKELEYEHKALNIHLKIYGEKHPDTASSYNNVGCTYDKLCDYQKALEYEQKALDIRLKVLDEGHPDTANSYNNVGATFGKLGNYQKELEYKNKALDICLKVYGETHPETLLSYFNIGMTYKAMGDFVKAVEMLNKAAIHNYADAQCELALLYSSGKGIKKNADKAMSLMMKACAQELPKANLALAKVCYYNGKFRDALLFAQRAVKKAPGDIDCVWTLAKIYKKLGKRTEALTQYEHCLELQHWQNADEKKIRQTEEEIAKLKKQLGQ